MTFRSEPGDLSTLSRALIEDWVSAMRLRFGPERTDGFLRHAGLAADAGRPDARVTLDQIVLLYQVAATQSGDEMMGLWSRPIRARALQHLLTSVSAADSLAAALFRFSTFWNLLLDDARFALDLRDDRMVLSLQLTGDAPAQRFGHMLILKLAHGLLSWLAGREVAVRAVDFAFARPGFAADYPVIFPAPLRFDAPASAITFAADGTRPLSRSKAELVAFVRRAPRDWLFTRHRDHSLSLRIRAHLFQTDWSGAQLAPVARAFGMTPRTCMRRLAEEGTAFREIRDALRRDLAIRALSGSAASIEEISQDLGFSSAANFHRAFQRWTGDTPGAHRRGKTDPGPQTGVSRSPGGEYGSSNHG
jgi:AraC-like DNA-binding protein